MKILKLFITFCIILLCLVIISIMGHRTILYIQYKIEQSRYEHFKNHTAKNLYQNNIQYNEIYQMILKEVSGEIEMTENQREIAKNWIIQTKKNHEVKAYETDGKTYVIQPQGTPILEQLTIRENGLLYERFELAKTTLPCLEEYMQTKSKESKHCIIENHQKLEQINLQISIQKTLIESYFDTIDMKPSL